MHFDSTPNGESLGVLPTSRGQLVPLTRTSLGSANDAGRVGPLIISEIQYNPTVSAEALAEDPTLETSDLEFVEIHNPTAAAADLTGWRLRGGVDYNFEPGTMLASNGTLVVMKFDPSDPENVNQLRAFRAHYHIDAQVKLVGGYAGLLNNSDDRVVLLRPEALSADPADVIYTADDEVLYDDLRPWPVGADGRGGSLQRHVPAQVGVDGAAWFAAPGTPGTVLPTLPGDFDGDNLVAANDIDLLNERLRIADNDLAFDLNGDGQVSLSDRDLLIFSILGSTYGDTNLDGRFNSGDFVSVFAIGKYEDTTPGNAGWSDGDWNGDGDFTTSDLVYVFQVGGYVVDSVDATRLPAPRELVDRPHLSDQAAAVDAALQDEFLKDDIAGFLV